VIIGSIVGHAACTGAAVLGGKHLAEHIDEKLVGVSHLTVWEGMWQPAQPNNNSHMGRRKPKCLYMCLPPVPQYVRPAASLASCCAPDASHDLLLVVLLAPAPSPVLCLLPDCGRHHVPAVWRALTVDRARVSASEGAVTPTGACACTQPQHLLQGPAARVLQQGAAALCGTSATTQRAEAELCWRVSAGRACCI
jgi:hypothetical protein